MALGASLVTGGVLAVVSAGNAPESRGVMSDEGASSEREDAAALVRDPDHVSRSDSREPGRRVHALPKLLPDPVAEGEPGATEEAESSAPESDEPEATDEPGEQEKADEEPEGGSEDEPDPNEKPEATASLPDNSGEGRRVVFDITEQQVWLVEAGDEVVRSYPVSGSKDDELVPEGTYEVFSKSIDAISWDYESTMQYMVRFHRGENSNIGFHDIPVYDGSGDAAQTLSELGTPLSDGCVRQDPEDAEALWDFAPVGTTVVVVRT
ncbi:L,D-transpeptidase family protein [Phytoactinopolyspora endophytica]|uniref:L,D-transpeptidase family protein n=1 Tax=Phytoactinopolyspora endophytica TaxID=1642495 RepID=UPI00101BDA2A|nr:L,D-transpeptidase family protein [Phytoactinopolyspora endophytica]